VQIGYLIGRHLRFHDRPRGFLDLILKDCWPFLYAHIFNAQALRVRLLFSCSLLCGLASLHQIILPILPIYGERKSFGLHVRHEDDFRLDSNNETHVLESLGRFGNRFFCHYFRVITRILA
jgi:hypothetical protein